MRSFLAILAGFVLWSILWVGSNAAITAAFPDHFADDGSTQATGILALLLFDSALFSLVAGWLTAKLTPSREIPHALGLGIALLTVGIAVQLQYWDVMPLWYHLIFLALLVPMAVVGGKLRAGQSAG